MKRTRPLRAVRPNAGIRAAYFRKIDALIRQMSASYEWWLRAKYRANEPAMMSLAADSAASNLDDELDRLRQQWLSQFDAAAPALAAWFAARTARRADDALRGILRDAGMTVRFQMNKAMKDALDATIGENVGLIRSIPQQYHTQVQSMVMQSVKAGRDLGFLAAELQKRYGITARRAAFISLDQNNKSTSAMMAARQTSMGIEEGIWIHSHAGKEPRPTHLANDGKKFNLKEGWFDPDPKVQRKIWPGELIRCRCVWRPVLKGFN